MVTAPTLTVAWSREDGTPLFLCYLTAQRVTCRECAWTYEQGGLLQAASDHVHWHYVQTLLPVNPAPS